MPVTTIHLILNAHIDPIWLWPWQAGLDAAIATSHSVCNLLDRHPDVYFTRGEAWLYDQIERIDPGLFARIRRHVESGQWHITGGWWIQPDCNLPSGFALRKQFALGKQYFLDRFGIFPRVAYNVDTFGHAAALPALMREAGQDCYVMMRPQEHEMRLPARVFRWRGAEGGPEVTVFRIARAYQRRLATVEHLQAAMSDLPQGLEHTMCFMGAGDHGGGPTEAMIQWLREHQECVPGAPGARIEFSTPQRFFEAIASQVGQLPLVTGELQQHAIGCYSVTRSVKRLVRQAEHRAMQAELLQRTDPSCSLSQEKLDEVWRDVCFHHFHDTLGGTCIPSAYPQVEAQLGRALAECDDALQHALRRKMVSQGDDPCQRMALFNASDSRFDSYVEVEPWLEERWGEHWRVLDEQGRAIPIQLMLSEAARGGRERLLLRLAVEPMQLRILRIDRGDAGEKPSPLALAEGLTIRADELANQAGLRVQAGDQGIAFGDASGMLRPRLHLLPDLSDNWSHHLDRYADGPAEGVQWGPPALIDAGPLMASLMQWGRVGDSKLAAEWHIYDQDDWIDLGLFVHWRQQHRLLKLVVPLPAPLASRWDGQVVGQVQRGADGRELPLQDWTLMQLADGRRLGIVCPDVFAVDVTDQRLRLTLLRSPVMTHHDPLPPTHPRVRYADQGEHSFRFRFFLGPQVSAQRLAEQALMMHRPPLFADWTRGMPNWPRLQ